MADCRGWWAVCHLDSHASRTVGPPTLEHPYPNSPTQSSSVLDGFLNRRQRHTSLDMFTPIEYENNRTVTPLIQVN